jgi:signal transduction histidine kinase
VTRGKLSKEDVESDPHQIYLFAKEPDGGGSSNNALQRGSERMNSLFQKMWEPTRGFLEKYFILVAAVVIYSYYLLTSINLIENSSTKRGFLDYLLQFDSLILMWVIAAVFIQLQKYRREKKEEQDYRQKIQFEFDRQRIHLQLLDEITSLLQDNVNNPLAVISITSHTIRRKFENDDEILGWLDRIDASLQRVHATINDIKAYQTQKIVKQTSKQAEALLA